MHVTLRQLKVLEAVARNPGFTRAAEKLPTPAADAFHEFSRHFP